jgi:hypothetical protein
MNLKNHNRQSFHLFKIHKNLNEIVFHDKKTKGKSTFHIFLVYRKDMLLYKYLL